MTMDHLLSAVYIVGVLCVLIIAHEWGHFIAAKLCRMRVEDFSIFFGKRLVRLGIRNGTEYNIRCIPLGGFVRIAGMEPDPAAATGEPPPPDPGAFKNRPLWQRSLVIFAGPFMSVFLGLALFSVMGVTTGLPEPARSDNVVESVVKGSPADRAGLRPGDRIVQINSTKIANGSDLVAIIHASIGKQLVLGLERGEQIRIIKATPRPGKVQVVEHNALVTRTVGLLGFSPRDIQLWRRYSPPVAVWTGSVRAYAGIVDTLHAIFSRSVAQNIGGPIVIGKVIDTESREGGPRQVIYTAALLSISVGVINLFPIPILDGGHLMMLALEAIRRRKLSGRTVYAMQVVGIGIIGVLFLLVMCNDILHVSGHLPSR